MPLARTFHEDGSNRQGVLKEFKVRRDESAVIDRPANTYRETGEKRAPG